MRNKLFLLSTKLNLSFAYFFALKKAPNPDRLQAFVVAALLRARHCQARVESNLKLVTSNLVTSAVAA